MEVFEGRSYVTSKGVKVGPVKEPITGMFVCPKSTKTTWSRNGREIKPFTNSPGDIVREHGEDVVIPKDVIDIESPDSPFILTKKIRSGWCGIVRVGESGENNVEVCMDEYASPEQLRHAAQTLLQLAIFLEGDK